MRAMVKKTESLTPRQRQSQRIMREKSARKKRQAIVQKLQIIGGVAFSILLLGSGLWGWKTGAAVRGANAVVNSAYGLTAQAGFTIKGIYLEGRGRTSMDDINKALGVTVGDPILRLSLDEMRQRLEHIESVRMAAVERELPGTLYVRIAEREPVALWQNQGKMALVDDNGVVMNDIDSKPYQNLPLIVGTDAPQHVAELMTLLSSQPDLAKRFASAIRVGDRRWNIRLASGVEIKLPENDPIAAWKSLADLQTKQQLLDHSVKVVDLRVPGRLFIKLAPQDMPGKTKNARET
jgi:cell division protein FtsQ